MSPNNQSMKSPPTEIADGLTQSPSKVQLLIETKPTKQPKEKKKKEKKSKRKEPRPPKLIINTFNTQYDVIMKAAVDLGYIEKKVEPQFYAPQNRDRNYDHPVTNLNRVANDNNFNSNINSQPALNQNQVIQ